MLIHTPHALVATLLGMLVELEQFEPAFAQPGERPEDALARLRPLLAIALDVDTEAAHSDLFFARAAKRGVRVVLFQVPSSESATEAIALNRGLPWFSLPVDRVTLAGLLSGALRARTDDVATLPPAGTLIFDDPRGRRGDTCPT